MSELGTFQIECIACKHAISFTLKDLEKTHVPCKGCGKLYGFAEDPLKRQLKKFAALCKQIQDSEEIFGNAAVAVDVGPHRVEIPFKLLLTRLKSTLALTIENEKHSITFRVDTSKKS